jgi:hypothetical protein
MRLKIVWLEYAHLRHQYQMLIYFKAVMRYHLACYHSRSRQRREFANEIEEWQVLFDDCEAVVSLLVGSTYRQNVMSSLLNEHAETGSRGS